MTYTKVNKPTGTTYTNVNAVGKQQYDQSDVYYDDTTTFYDGINYSAYTSVSKPTTSITWALATETWANYNHQWGVPEYYKVAKPT